MDDPTQNDPPEDESLLDNLLEQNVTLGFFLKGLDGPEGSDDSVDSSGPPGT